MLSFQIEVFVIPRCQMSKHTEPCPPPAASSTWDQHPQTTWENLLVTLENHTKTSQSLYNLVLMNHVSDANYLLRSVLYKVNSIGLLCNNRPQQSIIAN